MLADSKMETDGILQTLIIHTSFLELQITLQVLQYQSVELLQEHYAKFTLNLNNSALPSTVPWNIDINAEVFSFKCISQQIHDEAHPKWYFPINYKVNTERFI